MAFQYWGQGRERASSFRATLTRDLEVEKTFYAETTLSTIMKKTKNIYYQFLNTLGLDPLKFAERDVKDTTLEDFIEGRTEYIEERNKDTTSLLSIFEPGRAVLTSDGTG